MKKKEGIRYYTPPAKRYISNPKEKPRQLYATDEQFIKVQVYLDGLKKELSCQNQ